MHISFSFSFTTIIIIINNNIANNSSAKKATMDSSTVYEWSYTASSDNLAFDDEYICLDILSCSVLALPR